MKKKRIAVVDYGMGNLMSVSKALLTLNDNVYVTNSKNKILDADAVVLPGVGAFGDAIKNLGKLGLVKTLISLINSGKPFLGICLGLQLLFTKSEEDGSRQGLNLVKGVVKRFPKETKLKIPHMGWNRIIIRKNCEMLKNVPEKSFVYFVHSYYGVPVSKDITATETEYGVKFVSSIAKDNIFACQFHPEKSQKIGLTMLKNFVRII